MSVIMSQINSNSTTYSPAGSGLYQNAKLEGNPPVTNISLTKGQ